MAPENLAACDWSEWQAIVLEAFRHRAAALFDKGYQAAPVRKGLTAIFLQAEGFKLPASSVLTEALRVIKEKPAENPSYDNLAMFGHRIGMIENAADLKQYLQQMHSHLVRDGQLLFTSLGANTNAMQRMQGQNANTAPLIGLRQFQVANLIGPFFSMLHIRAWILETQAQQTKWQPEFVYFEDEDSYLVRLGSQEVTEVGITPNKL